ncbi:MAG TPA: TIGR03619 family F420-dependent LLM class oxidoreductase, partial [Blastocatellia bacterium]|nr:TIGR03619 family F420-dependent LLM class oxidoreductase [Blastocatellia bacterium]
MRFGVNILNFGPGASPDCLGRWARFSEETGYHFVMISDHVTITADVQATYPAPFYDPFTALAWIAARTNQIELGTSVAILPYRHPLHTARLVANLDQLSGGRFIFGIGAGWAKQEFEALDLPFHRRGALTDEYLDVIKTCLANDIASHMGRFVSFAEVHTGPRSVRSPRPPIWVGGASEGALRRAVRYGDGWHPIRIRVDWLRDKGLPRLRSIAEEEGKPVPALCPRITLRLTDSRLPEDQRVAGQGTLDQVRGDLQDLASLGAEYVLLDTYDGEPEATRHPEKDWAMLRILA